MARWIPTYNVIQKILIRVLYNPKNSITIFTEDKVTDKVFYNLLLNRLELNGITINEVIPLGPKSVVIEKSIEAKSSTRPSLFIVDGDIKLLLGQKLESENLIALDRYCMENFLCCEQGIIDYLHVKLGGCKEDLKNKLDFNNFIIKNGSRVLELYYRYAVAYDLQCGISFKNIEAFYNSPGPIKKVDIKKVNDEIQCVETTIKQKLKQMGCRSYGKECNNRINVLRNNYPSTLENILALPSGKDQLLPLLVRLKINEIDESSRRLHKDQIKRLLAEKIDIKSLNPIKYKIFQITGHI